MKNKKFLITFLSVFITFNLFASDKSVNWKLFFMAENEEAVSGDMSKIITISDSSSFQFNLVSEEKAIAYVIVENADGSIPYCTNQTIQAEADNYFPKDDNFVNLSDSCKIHVLVFTTENQNLKKSYTNYVNKRDSATASVLLDEISKIKQNSSGYMESPVKPATTGGTSRGLFTVPSYPYSEFTGSEVYVKTVRIKH